MLTAIHPRCVCVWHACSPAGATLAADALRVKDMPNQALYQMFEEAGALSHSFRVIPISLEHASHPMLELE